MAHWVVHIFLSILLIIFMMDGLTFLWVRRIYQFTYRLCVLTSGWVILIDLDRFKQFNDRHGHTAGDRLLRKVGPILLKESHLRAFRYGGDEFAILLPWGTKKQALKMAERIRGRVAAEFHGSIGISYGIGRWEEEADRALYEAKKSR